MKNKLLVALAVLALVGSMLACGSSNTGVQVGTTNPSTSVPPQVVTYKIGEVIQIGEHTIVLNSAEFQGNVLKANFTIENKGSTELAVSSMMSFEARDSEGTTLQQEIFDCGSDLGGTVLPGDKLKGDICWSGVTTATVKIYYTANFLSSGAVVWKITK